MLLDLAKEIEQQNHSFYTWLNVEASWSITTMFFYLHISLERCKLERDKQGVSKATCQI